ncbi:MAG: AIR synthase-related protein [Candidatus Neomarinimicrobiota bacterium]|nr:AIR synthase-related protein [Candidatus Neomarinimicrobiota bacterium]
MRIGVSAEIIWDQVKKIIGREPTEAEKALLRELRNDVHKRKLAASLTTAGGGVGEMAVAHRFNRKLSFSDKEIADCAARLSVRQICGGAKHDTVSLHSRVPRPAVRGSKATMQRVKRFGRKSNSAISFSFTNSKESGLLTAFSGSLSSSREGSRTIRDSDVIMRFSSSSEEEAIKPFLDDLTASADGHCIIPSNHSDLAVAVASLCNTVRKGAVLQKMHKEKVPSVNYIAVIRKTKESSVKGKARKHKVRASSIGRILDDGFFRLKGGAISLPIMSLGMFEHEEALPSTLSVPADLEDFGESFTSQMKEPKSFNSELLKMLITEKCVEASRTNSSVGETVIESSDGDIVAELDPRRGAQAAFASAARKVVGYGASPKIAATVVALPEAPDDGDYYRFKEFGEGLSAASAALQLPVTTADVSFNRECVHPQLTVAVIGHLENESPPIQSGLRNSGDFILMLGSHRGELGCSVYGWLKSGKNTGPVPMVDLAMERQTREIILVGNRIGLVNSATYISSGGLATSLAHAIIAGKKGLGARIHLSSKIRNDQLLFGETRGLIILTVSEESIIEIERLCMTSGIPCTAIGRVTSDGRYTFNDLINLKREKLIQYHSEGVERIFG